MAKTKDTARSSTKQPTGKEKAMADYWDEQWEPHLHRVSQLRRGARIHFVAACLDRAAYRLWPDLDGRIAPERLRARHQPTSMDWGTRYGRFTLTRKAPRRVTFSAGSFSPRRWKLRFCSRKGMSRRGGGQLVSRIRATRLCTNNAFTLRQRGRRSKWILANIR
jgi:hypothetical protein